MRRSRHGPNHDSKSSVRYCYSSQFSFAKVSTSFWRLDTVVILVLTLSSCALVASFGIRYPYHVPFRLRRDGDDAPYSRILPILPSLRRFMALQSSSDETPRPAAAADDIIADISTGANASTALLDERIVASTSNQYSANDNAANEEIDLLSQLPTQQPQLEYATMLERFYATISDLQVEFGSDAIAIVKDDEIEDELLDISPDDMDNDDEEGDDFTMPTINSLVFTTSYIDDDSSDDGTGFVLVVLRDTHRVNVTALEEVLQHSEWLVSSSSQLEQQSSPPIPVNGDVTSTFGTETKVPKLRISLAPSHRVAQLCGFSPGTVPPIGHWPEPLCTVIDQSLVTHALQDEQQTMVRGGGGLVDQSCFIAIDVLLQQSHMVVAPISSLHREGAYNPVCIVDEESEDDDDAGDPETSSVPEAEAIEALLVDTDLLARPKPFFTVAPPPDDAAASYLLLLDNGTSQTNGESNDIELKQLVQPVSVSFVGRIGSVRRMARGLAFCDVIPPDQEVTLSNNGKTNGNDDGIDIGNFGDDSVDQWPWRNPVDTKSMAVQLIAGKTLRQTTGSDEAIRRLQAGQLLLIHGRTNVGNRDSLRNWITKRSLDVVIQSYQVLSESAVPPMGRTAINDGPTTRQLRQSRGYTPPSPPVDPEKCLRMADLFAMSCDNEDEDKGDSTVVLVDDMSTVKRFASDLSRLLLSLKSPKGSLNSDIEDNGLQTVALVGVDCEWKPSYLLPPRSPQPVLLLQICLYPLNRVYLFDLQTLLRPMMPPAQSMDKLEREVSSALGALFESKRLIKVGFQVVHDLRQCAASFPHIPTLHYYNSVLECSTLGKKAIRIAGSGDARIATSSLSRLVDQFIGKPLNKLEQCSDWSKRPLTAEQIEYAALDAAVTPIMVNRMVEDLDAHFFWEKPQLGRWDSDLSFKKTLTSWRFVFVQTTDYEVQRKLKAKRVVGDPLIVSQSWTTGDVPPRLPALPENGSEGPYTDIWGLVQVPSAIVTIRSTRIDDIIDSMIGERVGKSKDKCVEAFLRRPDIMPAGARLDYPQRSGFVEFRDGVALFVNMPSTPGGRFQSRSYPNEWLNDGRVLTWFLRENDWKQGSSELAKKLVSSPNNVIVTLFVRMGSTGAFLCCGRCRVQDPLVPVDNVNGSKDYYGEATAPPDNWTLIKLHLVLLDWNKLRLNADFQALLNPDVCYAPDPYYGKRAD